MRDLINIADWEIEVLNIGMVPLKYLIVNSEYLLKSTLDTTILKQALESGVKNISGLKLRNKKQGQKCPTALKILNELYRCERDGVVFTGLNDSYNIELEIKRAINEIKGIEND